MSKKKVVAKKSVSSEVYTEAPAKAHSMKKVAKKVVAKKVSKKEVFNWAVIDAGTKKIFFKETTDLEKQRKLLYATIFQSRKCAQDFAKAIREFAPEKKFFVSKVRVSVVK